MSRMSNVKVLKVTGKKPLCHAIAKQQLMLFGKVAKAPEGPGSAPIFAEWMTAAELRVDEHGLAQAWVDYDAHFGEEGALFEWSGVDAFTLLRHDGRWRIVSLAYVSTK